MTKFVCHNCRNKVDLPKDTQIWGCKTCGCVNDVPLHDGTGDAAVDCIAPPGWAGWTLPAGRHRDPSGNTLYQVGTGHTWLTKDQYIAQLGIDPEIALDAMRKLGEQGVPGHFNCSTLARRKLR